MYRRTTRAGWSVLVAVGLLLSFVTPALAAPPANDTFPSATVIGSIPFVATVDTTEATTDAADSEWNASCGAPATDASVWYSFTATSDISLLVDTSGSSYTAGIALVTGTPGSFTTIACGPEAVIFSVSAGDTVSIVVFDDQLDGGGNGGTLQLSVTEAPPPPTVDTTVDPVAHFDKHTGSVTVTGTVTCTGDAAENFIEVLVQQRVGRFVISGYGSTSFICDGTTQQWSAEVFADNGLFKGGKAASLTISVACGAFQCAADYDEVTLRVRGGR
jgi:hypothetical protein